MQCLYFYPRPERFRKCSPSIPSFILSPVLLLRLPIFFKTELVSCHRVLPFIQHCYANLVPFMDEQKSHSLHLNYFKTELALTCQNKNNLSVFIMHQFLAVKCSVRYVPEHEFLLLLLLLLLLFLFKGYELTYHSRVGNKNSFRPWRTKKKSLLRIVGMGVGNLRFYILSTTTHCKKNARKLTIVEHRAGL